MNERDEMFSGNDAVEHIVRLLLRHNASLVLDEKLAIAAVADVFCSMFGVIRDEILGRPFFELGSGQWDVGRLREGFKRLLVGAVPATMFEVQHRFASGEVRPLLLDACRFPTAEGDRIVLTFADPFVSPGIQAALETSHERFKLLVESVTEYAIFMLDVRGNITSWNIGAERIKGYTAEEIIGHHFSRFYSEEDVKAGKPARALDIAATMGRYEEEGWRVRKGGTRFFAHVLITAMRSPDGVLRGFAKVTQDVTEVKRLVTELERSNRDLEQFAYVTSHDLQEPLRMISGWVGWLDKNLPGEMAPPVRKAFNYVLEGARRMRALIHDLLAYSKMSNDPFIGTEADLGKAVAEATSLVKGAVDESAASIVVSGPLPTVPGVHGQMVQLFQNLIGNAIKFRRPDVPPEIVVGALRVGGDWTIFVRDNGIGIPSEQHENVFKILRRLHKEDEYPGTGMGLSICKKIVERHGGKIWIESQPEKGATFLFTLPSEGRPS